MFIEYLLIKGSDQSVMKCLWLNDYSLVYYIAKVSYILQGVGSSGKMINKLDQFVLALGITNGPT